MDNAQLIDDNRDVLMSIRAMVAALSDRVYAQAAAAVFSGSVGKHLRHIVDHYAQCLDGYAAGHIDYDARGRDGDTEQTCDIGVQRLDGLCKQLQGLKAALDADASLLACPVRVYCSTSEGMDGGPGAASTLGRELVFLHNHAVHHIALMTVILQTLGIHVESPDAYAPATRRHDAQQA